MNPIKISQAVEKDGVPVVCATCVKYWKARDQNIPIPRCISTDCSSPIGGGTFQDYEGIIPDFSIWCFRCGNKPDAYLFIKGSEKKFGICNEHLEDAKSLVPSGVDVNLLVNRFYIKDGKVSPLNPYVNAKYWKKTAIEQIQEAEKYFNEKKLKKFEV